MRPRQVCLVGGIASLLVSTIVAMAKPASAAPNSKICSQYTNEQVWQTSADWARVRERTCAEWVPNGNMIRARGEFQIDWPSNCTLSVGLPPSGAVGCPWSTTWKHHRIGFNSLQIHMKWRDAA